jgi:D-aminoacyl-tRNA deacylase
MAPRGSRDPGNRRFLLRAVVQRVSRAAVRVEGLTVGAIGRGFLVLLGVTHADGRAEAEWLARKVAGLRVFEDDAGKMNLGLTDVGGEVLVVSQFTLYGDVRKGRRPSFTDAARPEQAEPLVDYFASRLREEGLRVETGVFGAMMEVALVNDGPVTLWLDTAEVVRET